MHFDFATMLFSATVITGLVWAYDAVRGAPARRHAAASIRDPEAPPDPDQVAAALKEPVLVEYCKAFFPVILIVFLLRSFLVEPFRIPSGSMMPTLLAGDFILVNKYRYGIRFPVIDKKVFDIGDPERGDVVVFRYPKDPSVDYIKRVVAVGGDRVEYRDKVLYINGERVGQTPVGRFEGTGTSLSMSGARMLREDLHGVKHDILVRANAPSQRVDFVVPEGHYFMMGDNRDNSNDSRFWGPVPDSHLVGQAFMIWMNWDGVDKRVSWDRIGDEIE